jgi:predicted Zn-dependent protease
MGALIAAILLSGSNPKASEAILASALANSAQQQLTYSRSNEQEADRIGLDLMAYNGFDPRQMANFFSTLQRQRGISGASLPEFFRTHPLTLSRIADTRNRAEQYPSLPAGDDTLFQLIQARTTLLTNTIDPPDSLSKAVNSTHVTPVADQYYRALHAARMGAYPQARKFIQALIQTTPYRVLYRYSAAQVELADTRPAQARKILEQALALFPGNPPLLELYANTLLQLKQPRIVFDILKDTLRRQPDQYRLYLPYAKAATALGNKAEAYRALAEFHYTLGNKRQAVTYLGQALQTPTLNRYDQLALEARQERLKAEVRIEREAREEEQTSQE